MSSRSPPRPSVRGTRVSILEPAPEAFTVEEFQSATVQICESDKELARERAGFDFDEVGAFRRAFYRVDKELVGELEKPEDELPPAELLVVLRELNLLSEHNLARGAELEEAIASFPFQGGGHGRLSLHDLMHLVRRILDAFEMRQLLGRRAIFNASGFTDQELDHFFQVYCHLGDEADDQHEFNLFALKKVVSPFVGSLNAQEAAKLKEKFKQHAIPSNTRARGLQLTFLSFIAIMGTYHTQIAKCANEHLDEQRSFRELLRGIEETRISSPGVNDQARSSRRTSLNSSANLTVRRASAGTSRRPSAGKAFCGQ